MHVRNSNPEADKYISFSGMFVVDVVVITFLKSHYKMMTMNFSSMK